MNRAPACSRVGDVISRAFEAPDFDPSRARLHSSNNIFRRYTAAIGTRSFFFDRYPNPDLTSALRSTRYEVSAEGVDSLILLGDTGFVCHRRPAEPRSLFEELSETLSGGGAVEASQIAEVARFLQGIRGSLRIDREFRLAWDERQVSWTVLERLRSEGWLSRADEEVVGEFLSRASLFYDRARDDPSEIILPKISLVDMVRGENGEILGLPILQVTTWPLLTGQVMSNIAEIVWYFQREVQMVLRAIRIVQSSLGLDFTTLTALAIDAVLVHGYLNVYVYGGDIKNLRDLQPLLLELASARVADECE